MKKHHIVVAAALAAAIIAAVAYFFGASTITVAETTSTPPPQQLTSEQKAWLGALEWCESQGTPGAINPKDSDGTPSYGILEFKPGTYKGFATLYGLASTTDYMNPAGQEEIVTQMILRGNVDLHQQFPACTTKLGLPPKSTATSTAKN